MPEIRIAVVVNDEKLKNAFKLLCALKGVSMKERIIQLVEQDVAEHKDKLEQLKDFRSGDS